MKYEICSRDVKASCHLSGFTVTLRFVFRIDLRSTRRVLTELNKTKHMIRLTQAAFIQSEGKSNKSEMSRFYSLRKILTVKKRWIFLYWSGYCSPFRTSKAHWYCILWWRNVRAHFMEIFFCFNKCLWICKLILALINEGMWFIVIFSDRI